MAQEYVPVDISSTPDLKRLAEAVRQSGRPHALKEGSETVAVIRPVPKKEGTPRARGRRFTSSDPLFSIRGVIDGPGPADMAANKDQYLAEAYAAKRR